MMKVHVLQHVPFEGLGSIASWLKDHKAEVTSTRLVESGPFFFVYTWNSRDRLIL
jgi:hypothetical protein